MVAASLGCPPGNELNSMLIEKAKWLPSVERLKLEEIADRSTRD